MVIQFWKYLFVLENLFGLLIYPKGLQIAYIDFPRLLPPVELLLANQPVKNEILQVEID